MYEILYFPTDAFPELVERFSEKILQRGDSVSLKCSASGNPSPTITWTVDDEAIVQRVDMTIGQYLGQHGDVIGHLNISNVQTEDSGDYTCVAKNKLGQSGHTAHISVNGKTKESLLNIRI